MNELQVVVQQKPGVIQWNFQDLKDALESELKVFQNMVYDDDSIKDARKDVANLRKLRKAVEEKRKEIKDKCLEPYTLIEQQAKELTGLIDKPISTINDRIQEYETARKAKCRKKILEYMKKAFEGIPEDIADKAKGRLYDERWENATAKDKEWKDAIDSRRAVIASELDVIQKTTEEEFLEDAMNAYRANLLLADATNKVYELRQQKERILKRQQEEAERKRREAELKAAEAAERAAETVQSGTEAQCPASMIGKAIESTERQAFSRATGSWGRAIGGADYGSGESQTAIPHTFSGNVPPKGNTMMDALLHPAIPGESVKLWIYGSADQIKKIQSYIKFIGAKYEEV